MKTPSFLGRFLDNAEYAALGLYKVLPDRRFSDLWITGLQRRSQRMVSPGATLDEVIVCSCANRQKGPHRAHQELPHLKQPSGARDL